MAQWDFCFGPTSTRGVPTDEIAADPATESRLTFVFCSVDVSRRDEESLPNGDGKGIPALWKSDLEVVVQTALTGTCSSGPSTQPLWRHPPEEDSTSLKQAPPTPSAMALE